MLVQVWIMTIILLLNNFFFHGHGFICSNSKWGIGHVQKQKQKQITSLHLPSSTKVGSTSSSNTNTNTEVSSYLLNDFKTASGELINPYKVLKISRKANKIEIRKSYIELSKRYHPDGVRNRDLLPGRCNNLNDVRDEWERIKLSYEILSNKKLRLKYDREEVLANPGAAIQRAAITAAVDGFVSIGKSIFNVGTFAVTKIVDNKKS